MKLVRKISTRVIVLFLVVLAAILTVDAILEVEGLPPSLRAKLFAKLAEKGLIINAEEVRGGFFNGLVLENMSIQDAEIPGMTLATASRLEVKLDRWQLLQGELAIVSLELFNAAAFLPLDDPTSSQASIKLKPLNLRLQLLPDALVVESFDGMLEGIEISGKGRIGRLPSRDDDEENRPLSIKPLLDGLGTQVVEAMAHYREFTRDPMPDASARLQVEFDKPVNGEPRVSFEMDFSRYLYRAIAVERLVVRGKLSSKVLDLQQVQLDMDSNEYVQGAAMVDLEAQTVQAELSALCYPEKFLKAFAPSLLAQGMMPRFEGPPPYLTLSLMPSPLKDPKACRIAGKLLARGVRLVDGLVDDVSADLRFADNLLSIDRCDYRVKPDTEGTIAGFIRLDTQELFLHVLMDGNPRVVSDFQEDQRFKRIYQQVWRDFGWNPGARPHLEVDIYRRPVEEGDIRTVVEGEVAMKNFDYRGTRVQNASTDVRVDLLADEVLLTNLHVLQDGSEGQANLLYHFSKEMHYLDFEMFSELEPRFLLGLVNPRYRDVPANLQLEFLERPRVRLRGHIPLKADDRPLDLRGRLLAPLLKRRDTVLRGGDFTFAYMNEAVEASGTVMSIRSTDWGLDDLRADRLTYNADDVLEVEGVAGAVQVYDNEFLYVDARFRREGRESNARLRARRLLLGDLGVPTVAVDIQCPDLHWNDDGFTGGFAAMTLDAPRVFRLGALDTQLEMRDHTLTVTGKTASVEHYSTRAHLPETTFVATNKDRMTKADVQTARLDAFDGMTLQGLDTHVTYDGSVYHAEARAKTFDYLGEYHADAVVGTVDVDSSTVRFKTKSDTLVTPANSMTQVAVDAMVDRGSWFLTVDCGSMDLLGYPFQESSGKVVMEGNSLLIHNFKGRLFDGQVEGLYSMDTETRKGRTLLFAHDLEMHALVSSLEYRDALAADPNAVQDPDAAEGGSFAKGRLDIQSDLEFEYHGDDLSLFGDGSLAIRDGAIWRVPVISEFLGLIGSTMSITRLVMPKDSGRITGLDARFVFKDDRVDVTELQTNGALMTIRSQGYYWWRTGGLDFRVEAKLLEKILKIPFNPLDTLLEMRLTGSVRDRHWEKASKILDFFRSTNNPTDPTLKKPASDSKSTRNGD